MALGSAVPMTLSATIRDRLINKARNKNNSQELAFMGGGGPMSFQAVTPGAGVSPEELNALSQQYGSDIYELQRRRLASSARGSQRNLSQFFAGRGGGASSAAASAIQAETARERDALANASLESQLAGREQAGAEANRREGMRQFDTGVSLQNLSARTQLQLQQMGGLQRLAELRFQAEQQRKARKNGLLGSILGGVGSLIPGAGFLGALGGLFGGGGGSSTGENWLGVPSD